MIVIKYINVKDSLGWSVATKKDQRRLAIHIKSLITQLDYDGDVEVR